MKAQLRNLESRWRKRIRSHERALKKANRSGSTALAQTNIVVLCILEQCLRELKTLRRSI